MRWKIICKTITEVLTTVLASRDVWHGCKTHTGPKIQRFEGRLDIIQLDRCFIVFYFLTTVLAGK